MKGRIGTKHYDTDKATLIETLPDGIQVYRKKGRSTEFFLYNPQGSVAREKFFDLPAEQAEKYIDNPVNDTMVYKSSANIRFSQSEKYRINKHAASCGQSARDFLLSLVDEYERNN